MAHFGFLAFDDLEELDYVGPWEMVGMWHEFFKGPAPLALAETPGAIRCRKGLVLHVETSLADAPTLDYLLVPGGEGRKAATDNPAIIAFLADQAARGTTILSVCTGVFLLQKAGLLRGRKATTHWTALNELRGLHVDVVEQRYVGGDGVWVAAGVSAGMDMLLALIAAEAGEEIAGGVQLAAEYYPDSTRYGSAADNVAALPAYIKA